MDHINEFDMIASQLNLMEINFKDEIKTLILMSSLPESWDIVFTTINRPQGFEKLKFDEIQDLVLSESNRENEDSSNNSLSVRSKGKE